jgi:nucleotide-binding universal stress UspA family protein
LKERLADLSGSSPFPPMKTIFVPYDFSLPSKDALRYAIDATSQLHALQLVVFHHNPQVYTNGEFPVLYFDNLERINEDLRKQISQDVMSLMDQSKTCHPGLDTQVLVVTETGTVLSLLHHAEKADADLIIMGSHGKSGFEKLVFGSVTAAVIEDSEIPVMVIPPNFRFEKLEKIMYASSLAHFQGELHRLRKFLKKIHMRVLVLHLKYSFNGNEHLARARHLLSEEKDPLVELMVVDISPEFRLVDQLLENFKKENPDCLVMFPARYEWYEKLFISSKTLELVNRLRKPLLVLYT